MNTGVGCHVLLWGIFPMQGLNPGLPHGKQIPCCLSHQVNLNAQPKDIRLTKWIKNKTHIYAVYETHFRPSDTNRLKVRGWKKIFHTNGNQKRAGEAILISDKIDFKIDCYKRRGCKLHNDQVINSRRIYNYCKYLYTQHRSTSTHKANANSHKRGNIQ